MGAEGDKAEERVGEILDGTYRLERIIGRGGMGAVYGASHKRLPRRFAVKLLKAEALSNPELFGRFEREAQIASSLGHESIAQVAAKPPPAKSPAVEVAPAKPPVVIPKSALGTLRLLAKAIERSPTSDTVAVRDADVRRECPTACPLSRTRLARKR